MTEKAELRNHITNGVAYHVGSYVDIPLDRLTAAVVEIVACSDVIGVELRDLSAVNGQPVRVFKSFVDQPVSTGWRVWDARCVFDRDRVPNVPSEAEFVRLCAEKLCAPMLVDLPHDRWVYGYWMVVDPDGQRYVLSEMVDEAKSNQNTTVTYLDLARGTWERFEDWEARGNWEAKP